MVNILTKKIMNLFFPNLHNKCGRRKINCTTDIRFGVRILIPPFLNSGVPNTSLAVRREAATIILLVLAFLG